MLTFETSESQKKIITQTKQEENFLFSPEGTFLINQMFDLPEYKSDETLYWR